MVYFLTNFVKMEEQPALIDATLKLFSRSVFRLNERLERIAEQVKMTRKEEDPEEIPRLVQQIHELRDKHIVALRDKHIPACQRWIAEGEWQEQPVITQEISPPWCDAISSVYNSCKQIDSAADSASFEYKKHVELAILQKKLMFLETFVLPDAPVPENEAYAIRSYLKDVYRELYTYVPDPEYRTVPYKNYFS